MNNSFTPDNHSENEKCTCDEWQEPHPCPFDEEVDGDSETLCNCCPVCTEECADQI